MSYLATVIAIYGAVLSTILGMFSLANYIRGRKYIVIETERSYGEKIELVDFRIKNLSDRKTIIEEVMIENYVVDKKREVCGSSGSEFPVFKTISHKGDKKLSLPFDLMPGETCYVRFDTRDAEKFISEERYSFQKQDIRLNLFCLELKHSQARSPRSYFFTMYSHEDGVLARALKAKVPTRTGLIWARIWKLDQGPR